MVNVLLLVGVIIMAALSWFVFDLVVPYPVIENICSPEVKGWWGVVIVPSVCIPDPASIISLPQRILNWWMQKIATVIAIAVVGFLAVFMLGSRKIW